VIKSKALCCVLSLRQLSSSPLIGKSAATSHGYVWAHEKCVAGGEKLTPKQDDLAIHVDNMLNVGEKLFTQKALSLIPVRLGAAHEYVRLCALCAELSWSWHSCCKTENAV